MWRNRTEERINTLRKFELNIFANITFATPWQEGDSLEGVGIPPNRCDVAKKRFCNVSLDRFVARQLALRLTRVRRKIATLTAEAEMIQRMIVDAEQSGIVPHLKLRRNSQGKWTVRGQVRGYLAERAGPVKGQTLYDFLKRYDPSLKASTFRSHLKRMVDDHIIKPEGPRGYYQLVNRPPEEPREAEISRPRRIRVMIRSRHL